MVIKRIITFIGAVAIWYSLSTLSLSCGQIGFPTGGPKDSLAPVLVKSTPEMKALNVTGNKITLTFDEYVEVAEAQNNVLISPLPKNNPSINYNLKTVTIRLKDTLKPNTTYSIHFGNAIKDVNEGNVFKNFTYVFSTGSIIDSGRLSGKLVLAETGQVDSTISVILYRNNLSDTAVQKTRPDYLTRIKGDGIFNFSNLPHGQYNIYALKDGDGNKYYSLKTEFFAFTDASITVADSSEPITLYAYAIEKSNAGSKITPVLKPAPEKTLKIKTNLQGHQDLLDSLKLSFNNPLKTIDTAALLLTDTNFVKIPGYRLITDSIAKTISLRPQWVPGQDYILLLPKNAVADSAGNTLAKDDTLRFKAKEEREYARVALRFKNLDLSKNPVLQLISNNEIKAAYPLQGNEWSNNLFPPGEYSIRILFDDNKDGLWTPGDYEKKLQPEKAITLPQKLSLRANWDNERDIEL